MKARALAPIPRSTLTRESVERLRRAILSGDLAEGEPLPESATAAKLGVSRVPVREALVELERQGLVAFGPSGRASVRALDRRDIEEIMSLRASLQGMAARLAVPRLKPEDLDRLKANVDRTDRAGDLAEITRLDMEFHDEIIRIARHGRLGRAWADLRPQIELWLTRLHRRRERRYRDVRKATVKGHLRLMAVLRKGRSESAGKMTERHCRSWTKMLPEAPL